jgi:heme/copper-type cytochrome/quinol oxidase subunit 3
MNRGLTMAKLDKNNNLKRLTRLMILTVVIAIAFVASQAIILSVQFTTHTFTLEQLDSMYSRFQRYLFLFTCLIFQEQDPPLKQPCEVHIKSLT